MFCRGFSIKDVLSQGDVQCGDYVVKGGMRTSSVADVRTILYKKLRIFQNLWCVRTDKGGGGLSQCGQGGLSQCSQGEGSIFHDFVRTSLMDGS